MRHDGQCHSDMSRWFKSGFFEQEAWLIDWLKKGGPGFMAVDGDSGAVGAARAVADPLLEGVTIG
jgi:hypothetical protein